MRKEGRFCYPCRGDPDQPKNLYLYLARIFLEYQLPEPLLSWFT
jgi:hypothetical protein